MSKKKTRPTPVPADPIPGLVDAHTHLASAGAGTPDEVDAIVARAVAAGVDKLCTVGDGLAEAELALQAAHHHERVYAACAIHPTRAHELDGAARARLAEMAADPRCVAVGETGLDTYWIRHEPERTAPLAVQEEALRWHIDLAVAEGKALMLHNREADEDLMRVLADAPSPVETILHCFSSPLAVAEEALSRGYVLSFAGNVTFKRNGELREVARIAPRGQVLIETDAPYLTPMPYRGRTNAPYMIPYTLDALAQYLALPIDEVACATRATTREVYGV